ncbi:alpha/beta fold hydrolase [Vibrio sp. TBV020]|uniref:alpha/beta fold hydrolase n=1 Tax=Vibrio sp. TBV020 TaxID=3137398 RepID=UPI0038CDA26E
MKKTTMITYLSSALTGVALLSGCGTDDSSTSQVSVQVPFNTVQPPMPNDGYGYDNDGTISLPDEPDPSAIYSQTEQETLTYYQNFETSFAGVDGWGLCVEPIEVPLQSVDSALVYPLDEQSLDGAVTLFDSETMLPVKTKLSNDGRNIRIECESALDSAKTYYLIVTDDAQTKFGESLQPDATFTSLLSTPENELGERTRELKHKTRLAIDAYLSHVSGATEEEVVYAATFTTQDTYALLDAIVSENQSAKLHLDSTPIVINEPIKVNSKSGVGDLFVKYAKYSGTLTSNYYLPFSDADSDTCKLDKYDPISSCPDMYRWMTNKDGSHISADNIDLKSEKQSIPVDLYLPYSEQGQAAIFNKFKAGDIPTIIFVHGVTADKSAASLMMKDYVDLMSGYAVVAIDMPYHGERIIEDMDGNPVSAAADKSYFININSPLTLKGNLAQAVGDFIALRWALNDFTQSLPEVHLVGHSLGGIVSVMISEMTQPHINAPSTNPLELTTANFVVPGQGLVNLTLSSLTLGEEMADSVKASSDVQRAIAETVIPEQCQPDDTNQTCMDALEHYRSQSTANHSAVSMLEDDIFQALVPALKQGVQTTIDASDPATKVSRQVEKLQPTLLIEAKGNCGQECEIGEYMPDAVVPNDAADNVMTGTEPLIKALALNDITDDVTPGGSAIRGVIRATVGGHGTYLFPYEGPMDESGLPAQEISGEGYSSLNTQQEAVYQMINSKGDTITFGDEDLGNVEGLE